MSGGALNDRAASHGAPRCPPGLGAQLFSPGAAWTASIAVSVRWHLEVLQTLGQGQFLLDGHPQERVEGLLLVLGGGELPLHLIQLSDVLVTSENRSRNE